MSKRGPRAIIRMRQEMSREEERKLMKLRHQPTYGLSYVPCCREALPLPDGNRRKSRNPPHSCGRKMNHRGPHVAYQWDDEWEHRLVYATWTWVDGDMFVDAGL